MTLSKIISLTLLIILAAFIIGCGQEAFPEPPDGLDAGETITAYRRYESGGHIHQEWDIQKTVTPPVSLISGSFPEPDQKLVRLVGLSLNANLLAQITTWRDECASSLADPAYINNPVNQVPQPGSDIGDAGLSEIEWCQAQVDVFTTLINSNGGVLDTNQLTDPILCPNCSAMIQVLRDSYRSAEDHTYTVNGQTISRSDLELSFTNLRILTGEEALVFNSSNRLVDRIDYTVAFSQCFDNCTQYWLPDGDGTIDVGWTEGAGDTDGSVFDEFAEGFGVGRGTGSGPDDTTTYWIAPTNPSNANALFFTMEDQTEPDNDTDHIQRFRFAKDASGGRQIDAAWCVANAAEACLTVGSSTDITTTWTTGTDNITTGEAATMAGLYASLRHRVSFNTVGGGPGRTGYGSTVELETGDGTVAGARRIFITE